jgi:hypothetical protein
VNWRCWFGHLWRVHQHNVAADEDASHVFVIAWKQCSRCGASRLIHILK